MTTPPPGDLMCLFDEYFEGAFARELDDEDVLMHRISFIQGAAPILVMLNDIHKRRISRLAKGEAIKAIWDEIDAFIDWSVAEGLCELSEEKKKA